MISAKQSKTKMVSLHLEVELGKWIYSKLSVSANTDFALYFCLIRALHH